ncbi:MAG: hypothetical protein ACRDH1_12385, partial [Actinomycetota bacterium]
MSRGLALLLAATIVTAACGSDGDADGGPRPSGRLDVFPASFDLAVGQPSRFLVGVSTRGNLFVSGGTVELRFSFLGQGGPGGGEPAGGATASFLPIPGEEDEPVPDVPTAAPGEAARGVYVVDEIGFDRPGFYEVEVTADLGGDVSAGNGAFEVLPEPLVPVPGQRAPRTENHVLGEPGVADEAIDSRAATGGIPDPELHEATIAGAIRAGRPALAV